MTTILANDIHGVDRHGPGSPDSLETVYSWMPPDADAARYVSPNGDDSNDGKSPGSAVLTIAQADSLTPSGGTIFLLGGTIDLPANFTPANATAIIGPGRYVCTVRPTAGLTGDAITLATTATVARGFAVDGSLAGLTSCVNVTASLCSMDDVQLKSATTPLKGSTCGSLRLGMADTVEIYDPGTRGIDINADGGAEIHFGDVLVTRTTAGTFDGGRVTRTTATDVGGLYVHALNVTKGAGTLGTGLTVTSTAANTAMPISVGAHTVLDSAATTALALTNIANVTVTPGAWLTCVGTSTYAVTITGGSSHQFIGAVTQGGSTGGAFDISAAVITNISAWQCKMSGGTLFKVSSSFAPVGVKWGGNRGYTTLTNDAATLAGGVNQSDFAGLSVLTSASASGSTFKISSADGAAAKYLRINASGHLEFLNGAFSTVLLKLRDNGELDVTGILSATGDFYANGALNHLGTFLQFFNGGGTTKQTVTGSRGGNAALASLLTKLAAYGLITDSTTA